MLAAVWYSLLLMLQVAQMDGNTDYSRLCLDLIVDSKPLWTVTVKGTARDGQLFDGKTLLGEFDASTRITQAYMIYPQELPPDRETEKSGAGSGKTGAAAKASPSPSAAPDPSASPAEDLPGVFALDFTKLVAQLKSQAKLGSIKLVPDLDLGDKGGKDKKSPKASPSPSPKAAAKNSPSPGASASASPGGEEGSEDVMEIRRYSNRTVLTWPSQGIVIVMTQK